MGLSAHLPLPSVPTVAAHPVHPARSPLAYGVMVLSGFAGLGYQIVWTQQCALWLGHEAAAVLAVVTAFFGGLGLGALACAPRIERSPHPARWYAACELLIALWSLALALLMAPISGWMLALTGVQPTPLWQGLVAFVGTCLLLLPATVAMGATLPAMVQVAARLLAPVPAGSALPAVVAPAAAPVSTLSPSPLAALYACNTLGAVLGVLVTAFWLVPAWGLARTAGLCAAANLLCAAAMLAVPAPAQPLAVHRFAARAPRRLAWLRTPAQRRLLLLLLLTGWLGIGYEVLVVRVISQVAQNTVYTFALLLAVYLVGSALGAAVFQRWSALRWLAQVADPHPNPHADPRRDQRADLRAAGLTDKLLVLLALACLLGTAGLWWADGVLASVAQALAGITGDGMAAALVAEATLALLAFGPATLVMGALFSHLGQQAQAIGIGFGRALGFNTLGAALAPLCFGVLLLPALGAKWVLLGVALGYLLLLSRHAWSSPGRCMPAAASTALALLLALWAPPLVFVDVPDGGQIISYQEGTIAAVSVVQDAAGVARLRIDNRQQEGSSASLLADARQALLPLLLHPAPQRALFLGLGTGVTASAAAQDPSLQVDAVELLPEVISASAHFRQQPNPRLQLLAADARRYVRTSPQRYDLVVADNFHPARGGSGALYTVQHFQAVRKRLTTDGVFCQWLPLHQLDLDSLRSIVQSFLVAYPDAWAMLATNSLDTPVLGLVARNSPGLLAWPALQTRLASHQLPQDLAAFGLADTLALLGGFVAGPQALQRFAGHSPLNTDDRPVVAYRAPRITYAPDSAPRDRLASLLSLLHIQPAELLAGGADTAEAMRLAAYWAARNRFIAAGMAVRPVADPRAMLAQVGEPLLAVLRTSPDFRPAYDPLLRLAGALGRTDPAGAQALLVTLQQLQPKRPEAAAALARLAARLPATPPTTPP